MFQQKNSRAELDFMFHPRSVAVIGATSDTSGKENLGNSFTRMLINFGYPGRVYPVGISGGEVSGLKIYANVKDIPGDVDYAIVAIPNRLIPQLVEDCGQKGVSTIHLFVSGFGEIDDKIGIELQHEMLRIALKYNIRLIGPNCMGIYCPSSRLTYGINFSPVSGNVGYLAQSGGQSTIGIREGTRRGMYFSKVVSYGNAADIDECDLIEYFTNDPETDIITAYIEGTNHGPRLFQVLKAATSKKPVVIFKGAATEGGTQAAISHTSAIAGSNLTWDALLRQTGVIRVKDIKEMFDVVSVLQRCPELRGLNTLVVGHGGGSCVQASDECYRAGLKMPMLPAHLKQVLMSVYRTDAGNIFKNPVDINPFLGIEKAKEAFKAIAGWEAADIILLNSAPEQTPFRPREAEYQISIDTIFEWAKLSPKPTVLAMNVNTMAGDDGLPEKSFNRLMETGFAVFPSAERAATALFRVYHYYQWKKKLGIRALE